MKFSYFYYNDTVANLLFPLEKDEAEKLGAKWQNEDYSLQFNGSAYEPLDDVYDYKDEAKQKEILQGILKCESSGKAFKIMPQELAFYLSNNIPIPRRHFDVRYKDRVKYEFGRTMYHRKCMNEGCNIEFETTYAPDRPEEVFCEKCYQNIIK